MPSVFRLQADYLRSPTSVETIQPTAPAPTSSYSPGFDRQHAPWLLGRIFPAHTFAEQDCQFAKCTGEEKASVQWNSMEPIAPPLVITDAVQDTLDIPRTDDCICEMGVTDVQLHGDSGSRSRSSSSNLAGRHGRPPLLPATPALPLVDPCQLGNAATLVFSVDLCSPEVGSSAYFPPLEIDIPPGAGDELDILTSANAAGLRDTPRVLDSPPLTELGEGAQLGHDVATSFVSLAPHTLATAAIATWDDGSTSAVGSTAEAELCSGRQTPSAPNDSKEASVAKSTLPKRRSFPHSSWTAWHEEFAPSATTSSGSCGNTRITSTSRSSGGRIQHGNRHQHVARDSGAFVDFNKSDKSAPSRSRRSSSGSVSSCSTTGRGRRRSTGSLKEPFGMGQSRATSMTNILAVCPTYETLSSGAQAVVRGLYSARSVGTLEVAGALSVPGFGGQGKAIGIPRGATAPVASTPSRYGVSVEGQRACNRYARHVSAVTTN